MSDIIHYSVEFIPLEGKLDEFKKLTKEVIDVVHKNEPDMINYQWHFNEDESSCHLKEYFKNSEAILHHLQNVGPQLGELLKTASIGRFEVYGPISDEASEAVKPLGAVFYRYFDGFTRK